MNILTDKKTIALASYLSWPGFIFAAFLFFSQPEKKPFARFHLRQSLGLGLMAGCFFFIFMIAGSSLFYFSLPSLIVLVPLILMWFFAFKTAMDEKETPLPVIGHWFQKWFKFI